MATMNNESVSEYATNSEAMEIETEMDFDESDYLDQYYLRSDREIVSKEKQIDTLLTGHKSCCKPVDFYAFENQEIKELENLVDEYTKKSDKIKQINEICKENRTKKVERHEKIVIHLDKYLTHIKTNFAFRKSKYYKPNIKCVVLRLPTVRAFFNGLNTTPENKQKYIDKYNSYFDIDKSYYVIYYNNETSTSFNESLIEQLKDNLDKQQFNNAIYNHCKTYIVNKKKYPMKMVLKEALLDYLTKVRRKVTETMVIKDVIPKIVYDISKHKLFDSSDLNDKSCFTLSCDNQNNALYEKLNEQQMKMKHLMFDVTLEDTNFINSCYVQIQTEQVIQNHITVKKTLKEECERLLGCMQLVQEKYQPVDKPEQTPQGNFLNNIINKYSNNTDKIEIFSQKQPSKSSFTNENSTSKYVIEKKFKYERPKYSIKDIKRDLITQVELSFEKMKLRDVVCTQRTYLILKNNKRFFDNLFADFIDLYKQKKARKKETESYKFAIRKVKQKKVSFE